MSNLSTSTVARIRLAALAIIGLGLAATASYAAPNGTVVDAPSCAGGFVAVCKKYVYDGLKIVGCAEYRCEMPKSKIYQSVKPNSRPGMAVR